MVKNTPWSDAVRHHFQCLSWFPHSIVALGLRGKKRCDGDCTVGGRKHCKKHAKMKTSEGFGSLTPYIHWQPQHQSMGHSGTDMFNVPLQRLVGELRERERERGHTHTHTDKIGLFFFIPLQFLLTVQHLTFIYSFAFNRV